MTKKSDQETQPKTADVTLKQLASLTMPPNYQGLLSGIDDNIAAARRTIDQSLASSSELIRQSLVTLTGEGVSTLSNNTPSAPVEAEAQQEGSGSEDQSHSQLYNDQQMAASLSGQEQTHAYYEKLEAQQQAAQSAAESEMAAAIKKTEQAITAGLEAQQQAQMELHQGLQAQPQHNSPQAGAEQPGVTTETIPQDNYQESQHQPGASSVADAVSLDAMSNTPQSG
jgi:hypothetical protein